MTDAYIDTHFGEIRESACAVEARLDDSGCTPDALKADNRRCIDGFARCGEKVALIDSDFGKTIEAAISELRPA